MQSRRWVPLVWALCVFLLVSCLGQVLVIGAVPTDVRVVFNWRDYLAGSAFGLGIAGILAWSTWRYVGACKARSSDGP